MFLPTYRDCETYVWGRKSNKTILTNKLLNIVMLCNDNDAIKYMSIKEACNHQCAKCGVLYDCGGCIEPFFTRKHDCKLQSTGIRWVWTLKSIFWYTDPLILSGEQNSYVIIEGMSSKYHTRSFEEDAIKAVLKYR
jgi:hypothetical protein